MQTRGVRGQKIPKNANVICERPLSSEKVSSTFQFFVAFSEYLNFTRIYSHIPIRSGGSDKLFKEIKKSINFLFFFIPKQAWKHIWPNWRNEKSNCRSQFQVAPIPNDGWLCPETTGICRSKMERYWTNWSEVSFDILLSYLKVV